MNVFQAGKMTAAIACKLCSKDVYKGLYDGRDLFIVKNDKFDLENIDHICIYSDHYDEETAIMAEKHGIEVINLTPTLDYVYECSKFSNHKYTYRDSTVWIFQDNNETMLEIIQNIKDNKTSLLSFGLIINML